MVLVVLSFPFEFLELSWEVVDMIPEICFGFCHETGSRAWVRSRKTNGEENGHEKEQSFRLRLSQSAAVMSVGAYKYAWKRAVFGDHGCVFFFVLSCPISLFLIRRFLEMRREVLCAVCGKEPCQPRSLRACC